MKKHLLSRRSYRCTW